MLQTTVGTSTSASWTLLTGVGATRDIKEITDWGVPSVGYDCLCTVGVVIEECSGPAGRGRKGIPLLWVGKCKACSG